MDIDSGSEAAQSSIPDPTREKAGVVPDYIVDNILKINKILERTKSLGNDIKETQRKLGKQNRENTRFSWKAADAISQMRKIMKPLDLWNDCRKLIALNETMVFRYARLGDYKQQVRKLCYDKGESADEVSFRKLLSYASIVANKEDDPRLPIRKDAAAVKNKLTSWSRKYKDNPLFEQTFKGILSHAGRKADENNISRE